MDTDKHTGFAAYFIDTPEPIFERNDYFDEKLGRRVATNWHTVDQSRLIQLEIWWRGKRKDVIFKGKNREIQEWIFYHTGHAHLGGETSTMSRTIGFKKPDGIYLCTVDEKTGIVTISLK